MLSVHNLNFQYHNNQIFNNLTTTFSEAQNHGLVGLNGSGKTTFLKLLYGFLPTTDNTILLNNTQLTKKEIAYMEAENFFYPFITGADYLQLFKINNRNFEVEKWNSLFQLPLHKLVETYSTGMKKKLALLGIISMNKPLFILDEPFNGLDMESVETLKYVIKKLKETNKTIIITSHIFEVLETVCDTLRFIEEKQINTVFQKNNFSELKNKISNSFHSKEKIIDDLIH